MSVFTYDFDTKFWAVIGWQGAGLGGGSLDFFPAYLWRGLSGFAGYAGQGHRNLVRLKTRGGELLENLQ